MPRIKKLSIGIQSFSKLIEEGYAYVDKTKYMHNLIESGEYYFLSRPRRFGKSLLISTLEQIFLGNRKLFKSCFIDSTAYDWQAYPVLTISFASMSAESPEILKKEIAWTLTERAKLSQIDISSAPSLSTMLKTLILQLAIKNKVAVLVDEYDYALLRNIENIEAANACREILRDFFSALKDIEVDKNLRFIFITGITKFSRTSIFSGLNNLHDLTLDPRSAQILGYTTQEIVSTFKPYLQSIAEPRGESHDTILTHMQHWYNGYQFADPSQPTVTKVYNPFSVLLYLSGGILDNYWFETGTPTFLMHLIKTQEFPLFALEHAEINVAETKSYDIDKIKLIPLLWQTGYLTIESYDPQTKNYKLTFPNEEVKTSFFSFFMYHLTQTPISQLANAIVKIKKALQNNDLNLFFEILQVFFAQIPYNLHLPREKYYQSIFYVILTLIDAHVKTEDLTNDGRIDAVIELNQSIWIFEFKLDESAQKALNQIEAKRYYLKYVHKQKKITLIGVQFNTQKRTISQWLSQEI